MAGAIDSCRRYKIAKVTAMPIRSGLYEVRVGAWWIVTPEDEVLRYKGFSNQCNENETVAKSIRDSLYPGFEVRQLPVVYFKADLHDYM